MIFTILENKALTPVVYRMKLKGDTAAFTAPGQFVQLKLPGRYLRRPISVCDWGAETVTLVYKVVGVGTEDMSAYEPGMELDVLTGLGNGFDIERCGEKPLLIGGGVGLPPMMGLARVLKEAGKQPRLLAGFNTKAEIFLQDMAQAMGVPMTIATMDGSEGVKGLVTDAMKDMEFDSVCCCGPLPMLKAIDQATDVPGQYSFEERMGCGFGACMGCTVETKNGYKRICKDGPVLDKEEILW